MKVLKFGGTSVGSPANMRAVMDLVTDGEQKIVVLSAMSAQSQAIDPRHRNARRVEPRDDQPGELAPLAHQHHDVTRASVASIL